MGEDNLRSFHKWKNYESIIKEHKIYVYPRVLTEQELNEKVNIKSSYEHPNIIKCEAPIMKISSSFIRKAIQNKKDVRYLLTEKVFKYVDEMNFYKLELHNREMNYNKMFGANPTVGTVDPTMVNQKKPPVSRRGSQNSMHGGR